MYYSAKTIKKNKVMATEVFKDATLKHFSKGFEGASRSWTRGDFGGKLFKGRDVARGGAEGAAAPPPPFVKREVYQRRRHNAKDQVNGKNNVEMLTVRKIGGRHLRHFKH